jgi:hypothetical protein
MIEPDDDVILVCMVDRGKPHVASRSGVCANCGVKVWVALSSPPGRGWCVGCVAEIMTDGDEFGATTSIAAQTMNDLNKFKAERNALFRNPTLEAATAYWVDKGFPPPVRPDVPLAMVHKARLQWLDATDAMLVESAAWLKDNGHQTTLRGGRPLTPVERDAQRMMHGKPPLAGAR